MIVESQSGSEKSCAFELKARKSGASVDKLQQKVKVNEKLRLRIVDSIEDDKQC